MNKRELKKFERLLFAEREHLSQGIRRIEEDTLEGSERETTGDLSSFAETGTDNNERETALRVASGESDWLRDVSEEIGVSFKKTIIRGQTTRWASCSRVHTISLNRSLLFLPKDLVRHVFLHELCHVRRLNHSPEFWRLLGKLEPNYKKREAETRRADTCVPLWAHPG